MSNIILEGIYWETEKNEYNIQISYRPPNKDKILKIFDSWSEIAAGTDSLKKEEVLIIRKKFAIRSNFLKLVQDLKRQQTIFLKEAL